MTLIGMLLSSVDRVFLIMFLYSAAQTITGILAILTTGIHLCFFIHSLLNLNMVAVSKITKKARAPIPVQCNQLQDNIQEKIDADSDVPVTELLVTQKMGSD